MSLFLLHLAVVLTVVNIFCDCLYKDEKELQDGEAIISLHADYSIPSDYREANTH